MIIEYYFEILSIFIFYKTIIAIDSQDPLHIFNNELNSNENLLKCLKQSKKDCNTVPIECMKCSIDENPKSADCIYGEPFITNCTVNKITKCQVINFIIKIIIKEILILLNNNKKGERSFVLKGICRFCYQTPDWYKIYCNFIVHAFSLIRIVTLFLNL